MRGKAACLQQNFQSDEKWQQAELKSGSVAKKRNEKEGEVSYRIEIKELNYKEKGRGEGRKLENAMAICKRKKKGIGRRLGDI